MEDFKGILLTWFKGLLIVLPCALIVLGFVKVPLVTLLILITIFMPLLMGALINNITQDDDEECEQFNNKDDKYLKAREAIDRAYERGDIR